MLITTSSSSLHFFNFLDVLQSALTITEMTLMLLMFNILLISVFSSCYLSIFSFSFSLTLVSPDITISIMPRLLSFLSFLFTAAISGFLPLISQSHWIITSHKIFTFSFSTTPSGACSYHFSPFFRLYFSHNFPHNLLLLLLFFFFLLLLLLS